MLKRNVVNLLVRLIILTTMVSALLLTSTDLTRKIVHADDPMSDPFCTACQGYATACMENCPALGEPGHFSCMRDCMWQQRECEIQLCSCWPDPPGDCPASGPTPTPSPVL